MIGTVSGERFKYPGQSFWVTPILTEGTNALATMYEEIMDETFTDLLGGKSVEIVPGDPHKVYNYHDCITGGVCPHCHGPLKWSLEVRKNDDRFCSSVCCHTRFTMLPDRVRIIASFANPVPEGEKDDDLPPDEDFLKELQNMNLKGEGTRV